MPIDPTVPGNKSKPPSDATVTEPASASKSSEKGTPQPPASEFQPPPVDPATTAARLLVVEGGGFFRRQHPSMPPGVLGDVLGDLGEALRRAGIEVQAPSIPKNLIQTPSRGGVVIKTTVGMIQLGLPMWTNKDAFASFAGQGGFAIPEAQLGTKLPHMIPLVFVVDTDYVDHFLGTDFLQYMYFVTKGTTFTIVAPDAEIAARIERFLSISYEGPRSEQLSESVAAEYAAGAQGVPDMLAELTRGFGDSPPSAALRRIVHLDQNGEISFPVTDSDIEGNVIVRKIGPMQYEVVDHGNSLGVVDLKNYPLPKAVKPVEMNPVLQEVRRKALVEGRPGFWAIGTGHGFSPGEETSGFMIFGLGREGSGRIVLVDPPSTTPEYLLANGIPLEAVDGVILTHGHTDHYGDAVLKLLRVMPKVKVYTTPTIQKMLVEQYKLGVGGKNEGLKQWNFVPVFPQVPTEIVGLNFRFEYGFHTVPTIGFDIYTKSDMTNGRCIAFFTGDTFADFANIWPHTKAGPNKEAPVMSMARALAVTRHRDHIMGSQGRQPPVVGLIEAGIPPIHTDPANTRTLLRAAEAYGVDVSGVRVYHIAAKAAADAGVPKWEAGAAGFIDLSPAFPDFIPTTEVEYAARILDKMPLLDELGADLKAAILRNGELKKVDAGTVLIRQETLDSTTSQGGAFYFLIDGEVQVSKGGQVITTRPNGLFGEGALLGRPRNADVVTTVPSLVLQVAVGDLPVKVVEPFSRSLKKIRHNREQAYAVVTGLSPLSFLPDAILDVLFLNADVYTIEDGSTFIKEGATDRDVYIVLEGNVDVKSELHGVQVRLGPGAMLGEMALVDRRPRMASVTAVGETMPVRDHSGKYTKPIQVIRFRAESLQSLAEKYPGIAIAMGRTAERREAGNSNGGSNDNGKKVAKGEVGYVTPDVFFAPAYAADKMMELVSEKIPAAVAQTLKGGFIFLAGDQLSDMALGRFHLPDIKTLTLDYAALTVGGKVGEVGVATLPWKNAVLGRALPLFSALTAQRLVHTGTVDLPQLGATAANVLTASGIVSAATTAASGSTGLTTLGRALKLVGIGGKATLLGAVVTSAAEFIIIKQLHQIEADLAQSGGMAQIRAHIAALLCADQVAIAALTEGQAIPANYLRTIDAQLAQYEKVLQGALNANELLAEEAWQESLAKLKNWYAAKKAQSLNGLFSFAELDARYQERLTAFTVKREEAMAAAHIAVGAYTPLPADPHGDRTMLSDAVDENAMKADVDMDGNPRRDAAEVQYEGLLAEDWKTLAAQIAQYRGDRAAVIERYQNLLPQKAQIELAMN